MAIRASAVNSSKQVWEWSPQVTERVWCNWPMSTLTLPRLYAIADAAVLSGRGLSLRSLAEDLHSAGVSLVQLRDKDGRPQAVLAQAALLREVFPVGKGLLVMNDRVDLAALAGFDGVHVGQEDLAPEDARLVFERGAEPERLGAQRVKVAEIVGISTHTDAQVRAAELSRADYVAVGPVFATGTKLNASPVVGLDGVRRARALTAKPLVAIGGITRANASSVIKAGADSVAVISGLFVPGETVERVARDFLGFFR